MGESSQPPPQTHTSPSKAQPNQDWLSQLTNILKPTPSPPPPPAPPWGIGQLIGSTNAGAPPADTPVVVAG